MHEVHQQSFFLGAHGHTQHVADPSVNRTQECPALLGPPTATYFALTPTASVGRGTREGVLLKVPEDVTTPSYVGAGAGAGGALMCGYNR
jgi:hypothetical protein